MAHIEEPARRVPIVADVDVVVAGAGPGGWSAAVAAARTGASTLLIERYGFMGGAATAGLIGPILGHAVAEGDRAILGGVARELCKRLHVAGGAPAWEDALKMWGVPFDPETMKGVLDSLVLDSGVQVMLHTWVAGAAVEDGRIRALIVENKSGRAAVAGKVFVDATGDGDVAFRAGASTHMGRPADGRPMSMGTIFRLGGVRRLSGEEADTGRKAVRDAKEAGLLYCYNLGVETRSTTLRDTEVTPNMTRFAGDPTSAEDLTRAEIAVRGETFRITDFFRREVPGYENAYVAALPAQVTPRESRQIEGLYTLEDVDIVQARCHDDVVALGSWWIDIHCPLGRVRGGVHLCKDDCPADPPCHMITDYPDQLPGELRPPAGGWYDIPYRALVSRDVANLLASGRCISATHQAMAGARVMGTCMAIGQAAGTAAALAAESGRAAAEVDVPALQDALRGAGALLEPE